MAETVVNWGVDTVFGMVGHYNLGFADALRRQEEKGILRYIGIRHEGAGAFAASAYGKLTGKPAACFSIAGPGATNMFTGLWDAKVDRAPILALTGQVTTQVVGTGNFQEVDLVRAFQTVAEFNHRVQRDSRHTELMGLAIKHAILKRDVSHLTFPDEIQEIPAGEEEAQTAEGRISSPDFAPSKDTLAKAVKLIRNASRPVIIVGHGARFHMDAIVRLAERLKAPVLTTFKGKGLISDKHPLALSKFHKIDAPVLGEISVTIELITDELEGKLNIVDQVPELETRRRIWREEKEKRLREDRGKGVSSIAVFNQLSHLAPEDAVMCVDVGNNAYSLGRYFECRKQSFLMSGYLGSIGFAFPAAMGAWAATRGKRPVIAVTGDGGFAQYMAELTTSVKYGMNIKLILLNNNELGKIS